VAMVGYSCDWTYMNCLDRGLVRTRVRSEFGQF
jgi:hypothetical protein